MQLVLILDAAVVVATGIVRFFQCCYIAAVNDMVPIRDLLAVANVTLHKMPKL